MITPRTPCSRSILWRQLLVVVLLLFAVPNGGDSLHAGWETYAPIDLQMFNPAADEVWLAGSNHSLNCVASDWDCHTETGPDQDSVTCWWTVGAGTIVGSFVGETVTYNCPDTSGQATITVHCDDNYGTDTSLAEENEVTKYETVSVVVAQVEWVEFGGTAKNGLTKKDANQWNPETENFKTDYTEPVPGKAWVRNSLADPVCYTKGATGEGCTTKVQISFAQALTESATITFEGKEGGNLRFQATAQQASGTTVTIGPMNLYTGVSLPNSVYWDTWGLGWSYKVPNGTNNSIAVGSSSNPRFITWGSPNGSTVTAKRMDWTSAAASGATSVTSIAQAVGDYWNANTILGDDNNGDNAWHLLDKGTINNDHFLACYNVLFALRLLGIAEADVHRDKVWASTDSPPSSHYASDVTDQEMDGNNWLFFTKSAEGGDWPWFAYTGFYRVKDGNTWKYWTIFDRAGPYVGDAGSFEESDKDARFQILDAIRDACGPTLFWQKWDKQGEKVALPDWG